jgi:hypothetical protein
LFNTIESCHNLKTLTTIGIKYCVIQLNSSPIECKIVLHYEKSCPRQLEYLTTKVQKQLMYNYTIIVLWKYGELINKMPHKKIKELYYSCKMDIYTIECTHRKYYNQPCLTLFASCILVTCCNYITTRVNVTPN